MRMIALALSLLALLECILFVVDGNAHRFGYTKDEQKRWHNHSEDCAGEMQSPIHLVSHRAVPMSIPALEMVYYHNLLPQHMKLINTGHSVSLVPEEKESYPLPRIFGALLSTEYELDSLHFHWGHKNSRGSEHIMNGIRFPVEMHIIHRNMKYNTIDEALDNSDGLTVLAFFFQAREKKNSNLDPVLRALRDVRMPHTNITLNESFTLASLIETDLDVYYTYFGSLTTPPCSEAVTWIVFPDPLYISFQQIKKFRRIMSGDSRMGNNFRQPQPLHSRVVYVRKIWHSIKTGHKHMDHNSISWVS